MGNGALPNVPPMEAKNGDARNVSLHALGLAHRNDARPNQAQSSHPRRADAACFRQTGGQRLDAVGELPAVAGSAWSFLGGHSVIAANASLADVRLKKAGELLPSLLGLSYMT